MEVQEPALLAALLVISLAFLGLGFYFGWVRKPKETAEEEMLHESQKETSEQEAIVFSDTVEEKNNESS